MTTRRLAVLTLWALSLFALAAAFAIQANASTSTNIADLSELEVAIDPVIVATPDPAAPEPVETTTPAPEPTLIVNATPVAPPTWVEIPSDLIATPTPEHAAHDVPLPILTNIASAPRDDSVVYLTFDDGPDPVYTNQMLDVLARYNAKATFFVLGSAVDTFPGVVQRIVAEGHALGNHTYYHEALPRESNENIIQTLSSTNNAIARATGRTTTCMRPPYGALDERSYQTITSQGYSVSMWEVDSNDWKLSDGYTIAAGVLQSTNLGDRVLFHDGPAHRAATVSALDSVLSVLSNRGVQFRPLPC